MPCGVPRGQGLARQAPVSACCSACLPRKAEVRLRICMSTVQRQGGGVYPKLEERQIHNLPWGWPLQPLHESPAISVIGRSRPPGRLFTAMYGPPSDCKVKVGG